MEKTIIIDGKKIKFKTTGATPLRYKAQFGRDYFKEILKLAPLEGLKNNQELSTEQLERIDFEVFYNIAWIMAKQADTSIPEPMEWLEQFDIFPIAEIIPELQDMLLASFATTKKKIKERENAEAITTEGFLVLCYQCGLSLADLEILTVGMALDYVQEWIEQQKPAKERKRIAKQSDFDNF